MALDNLTTIDPALREQIAAGLHELGAMLAMRRRRLELPEVLAASASLLSKSASEVALAASALAEAATLRGDQCSDALEAALGQFDTASRLYTDVMDCFAIEPIEFAVDDLRRLLAEGS